MRFLLALLLVTSSALADEPLEIKKIVEQKDENVTRRFVLTNHYGIVAKLGNGKYYVAKIERGYSGLGLATIVIDIKDEGKYGVQMYYTATRKQLLTGPTMYRVEAGLQESPTWFHVDYKSFPEELKKAFKQPIEKE
jgi:hypothetical protein